MELNLISKGKKTVVIELTDCQDTIVYPLVDKLLSDKDVLSAAYKTGHPQFDKPTLTVKTQRVNPETAIKKATEGLEEEIQAIKKEFEKSEKRIKRKKEGKKKPSAKKTSAKKPSAKPKKTKAKAGSKKTKKKSK